jgi:hypothetical protein
MDVFALVGAPAIWAVQGLSGWYLASRDCPAAVGPGTAAGALRGVQITLNLFFVVVAVGAFICALRAWRALDAGERAHRVPHDRRAYVAGASVLVSTVFMLAVAWACIAPFVLTQCVSGR